MDSGLYNEILAMLDELNQDLSVPKNVRKSAQEAKMKMENQKTSLDLRCATAISILEEIFIDPNVPSHGREELYTIISKLEALSKS
ncbi:UPF0147 family protein [Caldiplasma sukawensis]